MAHELLERLRRLEDNHSLKPFAFPGVKVVSFPRSGRTWIKRMSQCVGLKMGFTKCSNFVFFKHDGARVRSERDLAKYCAEKVAYRNARVILIVRDPRDVCVSHYFMLRDRMHRKELKNVSVNQFMRRKIGLSFAIKFMNDWAEQQTTPKDFTCFYYEEFKADPLRRLREFCSWCGAHDLDDEVYEYAIRECSFENMQRWDREIVSGLLPKPVNKADDNALAVRKGRIGGYVDWLDEETIEWATEYISSNLNPFYKRHLWPDTSIRSIAGSSTPPSTQASSFEDGSM